MKKIVLLSDFQESEYVGILKQILYSFNNDILTIDLSHNLMKFSNINAAYILSRTYNLYPAKTIFLVANYPINYNINYIYILKKDKYSFISFYQNILEAIYKKEDSFYTVKIQSAFDDMSFKYFKVLAESIKYLDESDLLIPIRRITKKHLLTFSHDKILKQKMGLISHIDSFGNAVTNLPISNDEKIKIIELGNLSLNYPVNTIEGCKGDIIAYKGDFQDLELSIIKGNFSLEFNINIGDLIKVEFI